MFDMLHIKSISDTIRNKAPNNESEQNNGICKAFFEILLCELSTPQHRFIQFFELFQGECIKFVENRLINWINLQGSQLKVFIGQKTPPNNFFPLVLAGPNVYEILLVIFCVFQVLVRFLYHEVF